MLRAAALGLLVLTLGLGAAPAQAGWKTLHWTQPDAESIEGFRAHLGSRSGVYYRTIQLGKPLMSIYGVFMERIDLGNDPEVFISISAYDYDGRLSVNSNEIRVEQGDTTPLGQPGVPALVP